MRLIKSCSVIALSLVALMYSVFADFSGSTGLVLRIETKGDEVIYELDGAKVKLSELLNVVTDLNRKDRREEAVIIFDCRVPLDTVLNARGILSKIGFRQVNLFAYWSKTQKICQITLGEPKPFQGSEAIP